jgi:hypothetical protein
VTAPAPGSDSVATPPRRRGVEIAMGFALAALLALTFSDVVWHRKTLVTSPYAASVMGTFGAYGYPGSRPVFNPYVLDPGASAWQWEPLTAKTGRLYRGGAPPIWNASQGFGSPLAANMHSSVYYLPALPLMLWPTPDVWNGYLLGRLLFAGLSTAWFLRMLGAGAFGALAAGAAFMLSGAFLLWVSDSWLNVDILVPAVVLGVEAVVRRARPASMVLLALAVAGTLVGGMPESTFVVLLLGIGYGLARLVVEALGGTPTRTVVGAGFRLAVVSVAGVGLSGVLLVPFAELVGNSLHFHGVGATTGERYAPLWSLAQVAWPYLEGAPLASPRVPLHYTGSAALVLGAVALASRGAVRSLTTTFFGAALVLSLAKMYGLAPVQWAGSLPVFELVDYPKHLGVIVCFCVAVLAGLGVDAVAGGRVPARRGFFAVAGAAAFLGGALWLHGWPKPAAPDAPARFGPTLWTGLALAAVLLAGNRPPAAARAVLCLVLLAVEVALLAPRPKRPRRYPADTPPPAVEFVWREAPVARVFGLDGALYPSSASYFDLQDIRMLDALYPARYAAYVQRLLNPSVHDRFTGGLSSGPRAETPTRCHGNPWFDLAGVGWILSLGSTPETGCETPGTLLPGLVAETAGRTGHGPNQFTIDGRTRGVFFQHPPSEVRIPLTVRGRRPALVLAPALAPDVWSPEKGDGVQFRVELESDAGREVLFDRWIDPKREPRDRRWVDVRVDLSRWRDRTVTLVLTTAPGVDGNYDWAGWAEPRLAGDDPPPAVESVWPPDTRGPRDLQVYRNGAAFPRAFLVTAALPVADGDAAFSAMEAPGFDPAQTVVVEGLPTEVARRFPPSAASAEGPVAVPIVHYDDLRAVLRVETPRPALLVLTDLFYPGWTATVDGAPTRIWPAYHAFRAVEVPAGTHDVEFRYRPASFTAGLTISGLSLVVLIGFVAIAREPREEPQPRSSTAEFSSR